MKKLISAFLKAVQRNELDAVKQIVADIKKNEAFPKNVSVINKFDLDKSGETALHICAKNGYLEMMRYFVEEEGAHLELTDFDGKTPLHDAAQFSKPEIVKYLISKGANVNVVKRADWTPLMLACTKTDNLPVVQTLVNSGADLSFVNKDGWTCVHIASREGNVEVIKCLLNSTSNARRKQLIDVKSKNGRKPIHTAVMHGNLGAVKILTLDVSGKELNSEDNCGSTPLMDACRSGFVDVAQFLIEGKKIDPTTLNRNGVGLLHVAAEANQGQIIEFLVERFALDVNQRSNLLGFTSLHWASREGNVHAVDVLLKLGANPDMEDAKGKTAKNIAEDFQKKDLCLLYAKYDKNSS